MNLLQDRRRDSALELPTRHPTCEPATTLLVEAHASQMPGCSRCRYLESIPMLVQQLRGTGPAKMRSCPKSGGWDHALPRRAARPVDIRSLPQLLRTAHSIGLPTFDVATRQADHSSDRLNKSASIRVAPPITAHGQTGRFARRPSPCTQGTKRCWGGRRERGPLLYTDHIEYHRESTTQLR